MTDLYATQTKTEPVWKAATDAGWFEPGEHVLHAEVDTPGGTVSLTGSWSFASATELPAGAAGLLPSAAPAGSSGKDWTTVMVPDSLGVVDDRWNDHEGVLGTYHKTIQFDAPDDRE